MSEPSLGAQYRLIAPLARGMGHVGVLPAATFSGHKLHIYCRTMDDAAAVIDRLGGLAVERGLGVKAGTPKLFSRPDNDPQRHKGVTVYLPRRATVDADLAAVVDVMAGYQADGPIPGDTHVGNGVSRRFDFSHDPGRDVTKDEADALSQRSAEYAAHRNAIARRNVGDGGLE